MNNKIKMQHYVPKFYLKNFAVKKDKINVFDKSKLKEFVVDIRGIGGEKYFYDTSKDNGQLMEKSLGKVESIFSVAYNKLLKEEDLSCLTKAEKVSITYFAATQMIRTREYREGLKDIIKQTEKLLSKDKISKGLKKQLKEVGTEESIKTSHLNIITENVPRFAEIINNMKWILMINQTAMPFWTSDHPISRYNPINVQYYGNLGLLCKGIQIHFPLSSKLSLCFCDPVKYYLFPEKDEIRNIQNIVFQNHLQVAWSTRHIFATNNDFSLAETMIKDNPSLGDIDRKRVSVN